LSIICAIPVKKPTKVFLPEKTCLFLRAGAYKKGQTAYKRPNGLFVESLDNALSPREGIFC